MRYRVIFWMFSLFSIIIWLSDTGRWESIQAAGAASIVLAIPANSSAEYSSNNAEAHIAKPVNTEINKNGSEYFLMSDGLLERPALLTGSDRGTVASLLVVERWESSPIEDHFTYSTVLKSLIGNTTDNNKFRTDYSKILLSADAMKAEDK